MIVILQLSGPALIISMVVGLVIAVFQAATQVHEQTLTFVPKLIAIAVLLLIGASWMITTMNDFITEIFALISEI